VSAGGHPSGRSGPGSGRPAWLGLGSNVGDRFGNLREAIRRLTGKGLELEAVSSAWETQPVGEILDQPDFLNAAIRVRTVLGPEDLLDVLKLVEREQGREAGRPRHSPRLIDIDLLLLDRVEYRSDRLDLPHREVTTRRFVLVPLLEIDPDLVLPDGTRLADALEALDDDPDQAVSRAGSLRT
jgi:2-amino-4-hydroxy-6-hydroxymethyldihydropteridine diphosphokinase